MGHGRRVAGRPGALEPCVATHPASGRLAAPMAAKRRGLVPTAGGRPPRSNGVVGPTDVVRRPTDLRITVRPTAP